MGWPKAPLHASVPPTRGLSLSQPPHQAHGRAPEALACPLHPVQHSHFLSPRNPPFNHFRFLKLEKSAAEFSGAAICSHAPWHGRERGSHLGFTDHSHAPGQLWDHLEPVSSPAWKVEWKWPSTLQQMSTDGVGPTRDMPRSSQAEGGKPGSGHRAVAPTFPGLDTPIQLGPRQPSPSQAAQMGCGSGPRTGKGRGHKETWLCRSVPHKASSFAGHCPSTACR